MSGVPLEGVAIDANGDPVTQALIVSKKKGTSTDQALYEDEALTTPAANPYNINNSAGYYALYRNPLFDYDIEVQSADGATVYNAFTLNSGGGGGSSTDAHIVVDAISELQALVGDDSEDLVHYIGIGDYRWRTGDQSSLVGADEVTSGQGDGGRYVAPSTDRTGASGCWDLETSGTVPFEAYRGGAGGAADDQSAWEAIGASGQGVCLSAGKTYYMTAGITPVDGFGVEFRSGSKLVLVTQASGSGSAGFKNYSGLNANRNTALGTAFMLTVDGGEFNFRGKVHIEGDNNNQPILRPILAQNCTLNIEGTLYVRNLNACMGALSLSGMRGGEVWRVDVQGNAEMDDSAYTDITNVAPSGLLFDDLGTVRSARMSFGRISVKSINREAAGVQPNESDAVTLGGIDLSPRSGAITGHHFEVIHAEDVGEAFDCFQSDNYIGNLVAKDVKLYGAKFIHGAQRNTVQNIDVRGFGTAGIAFCGSGASTNHCEDNRVLGGRISGADASNADSAPVYVLDNGAGTASVPKNNCVVNVDFFAESTSDYIIRSNLDSTTAGALAAWEDTRIINCRNLGASPNVSFVLDAEGTVRRILIDQRSAIADPSGGATVDAESRTAISAILSALEAHGFIAT